METETKYQVADGKPRTFREDRCSSLPRIMLCPASATVPDIDIDSDTEAARIGSATHELLANMIQENEVDIHHVAGKWRVDADMVAPLYFRGVHYWKERADLIEIIGVEERSTRQLTDHIAISGHADIIGHIDDTLIVLDWKTGSPETDYHNQQMGYGWLHASVDYERIKIITVWLREGYDEITDVTWEELREWEAELIEKLQHPDTYNPGEACAFCPRAHECPARTALVQTSIKDFVARGDSITDLTPAGLAALHPQAKMLKRVLGKYDAALKSVLEQHGPQPLGDGREIALVENVRKTISAETLSRYLERPEIYSCLTVNKKRLRQILANTAPPQQKGKTIKAFMDELENGGGITESRYNVTTVRKVQGEKEDGASN